MNQAADRKLMLRVSLKLLLFAALLCVVFVSIQYSFKGRDAAKSIRIDLSDLGLGDARIVDWNSRPVMILHRTQAMLDTVSAGKDINPYLVIFQRSPDYSCPVEIVMPGSEPGGFRAVCSGTRYDFEGRLLPGQNARLSLRQPAHSITGDTVFLGSE